MRTDPGQQKAKSTQVCNGYNKEIVQPQPSLPVLSPLCLPPSIPSQYQLILWQKTDTEMIHYMWHLWREPVSGDNLN